jgi:hypothetical protein
MRFACLVALAVIAGNGSCGSPTGATPVVQGQVFELRPGAAATLEDGAFVVTFQRVVNDSRCPQGVTCVWEGDAVAELALAGRGAEASTVQLHTAVSLGNQSNHGSYAVRLTGVSPYPHAGAGIDPADYRVTLVVSAITR